MVISPEINSEKGCHFLAFFPRDLFTKGPGGTHYEMVCLLEGPMSQALRGNESSTGPHGDCPALLKEGRLEGGPCRLRGPSVHPCGQGRIMGACWFLLAQFSFHKITWSLFSIVALLATTWWLEGSSREVFWNHCYPSQPFEWRTVATFIPYFFSISRDPLCPLLIPQQQLYRKEPKCEETRIYHSFSKVKK